MQVDSYSPLRSSEVESSCQHVFNESQLWVNRLEEGIIGITKVDAAYLWLNFNGLKN